MLTESEGDQKWLVEERDDEYLLQLWEQLQQEELYLVSLTPFFQARN